jgi:hypothetical protein
VSESTNRLSELLGERARFAATGDGGQVVEVHAEVEFATLAVVGDGDRLTRLGVIPQCRGIGHAHHLEPHQRLGDLQRLWDHPAQRLGVRAVDDGEIFTVEEAVRSRKERRCVHRRGELFSDLGYAHGRPPFWGDIRRSP